MPPAPIHVAKTPPKPLMIYDGNCNFCKFWIIRWQRALEGRVDFLASQDSAIATQFPEIPREAFDESVQLIETDGAVYSGAEAVFRGLAYARHGSWPLEMYRGFPGVKPVTEFVYGFVSRRRTGFSILTRWLWGRRGALPAHNLTTWIFLRALGLSYLCAFLSLGSQIMGLSGSNGIVPAKDYMRAVSAHFDRLHVGAERYTAFPTLCWFDASDNFLRTLCALGTLLSLLLIANISPAPCLFLMWLIYLSLSCACGVFLSFQWDILLLEAGFLAIFLAPLEFFSTPATAARPSRMMLWLLRWLLFRLMFESGLVKLASGDVNWHNLTALDFHYETQPLPTWIGWYAHQLPEHFQKFCVFAMFTIELVVPFLIFLPRRIRFTGCALLVFLQICIALTGNYCFFNFLTMALCLLLLDDALLARLMPRKWRERFLPEESRFCFSLLPTSSHSGGDKKTTSDAAFPSPPTGERVAEGRVRGHAETTNDLSLHDIAVPAQSPSQPTGHRKWPASVIAVISIVVLVLSLTQVLGIAGVIRGIPSFLAKPLGFLEDNVAPLRAVNTYGLFAVMTTSRLEIVIEGSNDGQAWQAYEFKYKPGDVMQRPGFVAPHQPRLDWQMWFAALGDYQHNPWLVNFCGKLLQGSPQVLALLEKNPFPSAPPKFIRAQVYDYHFTNAQQHRETGAWWRRQFKGEYLPAFSLEDLRQQ